MHQPTVYSAVVGSIRGDALQLDEVVGLLSEFVLGFFGEEHAKFAHLVGQAMRKHAGLDGPH